MEDFITELSKARDVRVSICYMLSKLDRPVEEKQLYEIILNSGVINYFDYTEALNGLLENGAVSRKDINGESCIFLEEKGQMGSDYFNEYIPYHFRKRILRAAFSYFSKLKRESETDITVKEVSNGWEVEFTIRDVSFELMRISLYAPDMEQAALLKEKILLNPAGFYNGVISSALNNEEENVDIDK